MQVGVEIGGTFTDLVWLRFDGQVVAGKVPSTPSQIHQAVLDATRSVGVPLADVKKFTHGSTIATNVLLTRRGAVTGLLTTAGFRDIIEIGTHDRVGNIYTAFYNKAAAPIPRYLVREIEERIDASGNILAPLDEESAWREIEALLAEGVTSIAICLLHAYRNPVHEYALIDLIRRRAPSINVFASFDVSPEFREYERTVTTAVNAFVGPFVKQYVQRLEEGLRGDGYKGALRLMQSNGGIMPASAAGSNAVRMLLSGPAAGVRAAVWFAKRNAISDILTLDMGGTSTDVAVAPALEVRVTPEMSVDGLPIRTTAIDMVTVGAGGGSIASIDTGGFLNVGPASAGAVPGPACYDRGGVLPTATDAQAVAGLLRPAHFFGGRMALRLDLAERALETLNLPGGAQGAADAILRMVNSNMAAAVRLVSTARGIDPRGYTLVAYGGGGPVHGAMVADEIGIRRVLIPWSPGISSAFGLLIADLIVDIVQVRMGPLTDASFDDATIAALRIACEGPAEGLGLSPGSYEIEMGIDLRYAGQGFELTIWNDTSALTAAELQQKFHEEHRARFGYARASLPVQAVNLRARIRQRNDAQISTPHAVAASQSREIKTIVLNGSSLKTIFLSRGVLTAGEVVHGPAVIEEATSTTFVPPTWWATCLPTGDMLLEKNA